MTTRIFDRLAAPIAVACLAGLPLLSGCIAHSALQGEPGLDLSPIRTGVTRAEVEAVVGETEREWTTSVGVRYRVYAYDAGVPPSSFNAFKGVLAELMTLGLIEVMAAADPEKLKNAAEFQHLIRDLAVAYDSEDRVIGVFPNVDNTTVLPADGRPQAK